MHYICVCVCVLLFSNHQIHLQPTAHTHTRNQRSLPWSDTRNRKCYYLFGPEHYIIHSLHPSTSEKCIICVCVCVCFFLGMFRPNHAVALPIPCVWSRKNSFVCVCEGRTMYDIMFRPDYTAALSIPCVQSRKNSLVPFTLYCDKTSLLSMLKQD